MKAALDTEKERSLVSGLAVFVYVMQMHTCMNSMIIQYACTCQEMTRSDGKVSAGTPQGSGSINGWEY